MRLTEPVRAAHRALAARARFSADASTSSRALDALLERVSLALPRALDGSDSAPSIVVGLSGGVDSAVALWALKALGARATAALARNWDGLDEDASRDCGYRDDLRSAESIARHLNVDFREVDFTREYWCDVFEPYVRAFEHGATPNPDLECNRSVKFGALLRHVTETMGAEYLATGHYARIERRDGGAARLLRGRDEEKDQSYFLASVPGEALRRACFPLGDVLKSETREAARALGLPCADRRSSAGICFIGRRPFGDFIGEYITPRAGAFVDAETSRPVPGAGQHRGLASYTVGQRAKIGGAAKPWFVVGKNVAENVVYVANGADHEALFSSSAALADEFWISGERPVTTRLLAKTRYAAPLTPVTLKTVDSSDKMFEPSRFSSSYVSEATGRETSLRASFERPERAVTPGQALVLYDGDVCLGGAIVERVGKTSFETRRRGTDPTIDPRA